MKLLRFAKDGTVKHVQGKLELTQVLKVSPHEGYGAKPERIVDEITAPLLFGIGGRGRRKVMAVRLGDGTPLDMAAGGAKSYQGAVIDEAELVDLEALSFRAAEARLERKTGGNSEALRWLLIVLLIEGLALSALAAPAVINGVKNVI